MAMFDQFIFVDWSANSTPKTGKDSIWIADTTDNSDINITNPATRHQARHYLLALLKDAVAERRRVLIGFDFAYSYPSSVLRHMAERQGPNDFASLWKLLHERIRDERDNTNDRYVFSAWANEHWFQHHHFWGFPSAAQATTWLRATKTDSHLPELRIAESHMRGTQPTRKLAYVGSVGSQALLGMRCLHALRNDPTLAGVSCVWPMETGFALPDLSTGKPMIVHAEIYPTPVPAIARQAGITMPPEVAGMVHDAQQVWACVALARHEDARGSLGVRFEQPTQLQASQCDQARAEGWILWT
jgi:precorrin-8X/cobalt-precorrin-8 methylmutase